MAVKRNYRINLRNYGNPSAVMVSQYDENYSLTFEVYDGPLPASGLNTYTVKLVGTRADTLKYSFDGTVTGVANNVLNFTIDTTMTACAGKGVAEIVILDATNDVKFASFNLPVYVEKAAVPDDAVDADVERAQEIAEQVEELIDGATEGAEAWAVGQRGGVDVESTDPTYHNNSKYYAEQAQEIADSIGIDATLSITGKAADAKKTGDEISSLKEDLNSKLTIDNGIVFCETTQGKYQSNGTYLTTGNWRSSYTDIIPCSPNDKFEYTGRGIANKSCPSALFYDANGDFVSSIDGITTAFGYAVITIPDGVYGVRFQLALALASGDVGHRSAKAIDPISYSEIADTTKSLKTIADNSSVALDVHAINLLDNIDKTEWVVGKVNIDTGGIEANGIYATCYIPIEPYIVYDIKYVSGCFCDENKSYVGKSLIAGDFLYTNDDTAKFAKISIAQSDYESGTPYFRKHRDYYINRKITVSDDLLEVLTTGGAVDIAKNDTLRFEKTDNLFNIYDTEWLYSMGINNSNGYPGNSHSMSNGAIAVMFIPVEEGETVCSNMDGWNYCLYDADKAFISNHSPSIVSSEVGVYTYHVHADSGAKYMCIALKFSKDGTHGVDTDAPNGWIRSDAEIKKVVIWKKQDAKYYPLDEDVNRSHAYYKLIGQYVNPDFSVVPDKNSELFRMIRCEAIRAVNHTKYVYRIGCFNQYVQRGKHNWPQIKNMLADYGIDICGFNEAQYSNTQDTYKKASLGDYLKGWQFEYSATFYPLGTTESPYSNRDMVSMFPVVESEELFFPPDSRYGQYNNRSALRTKIKLPRYLDCTGGEQYLGFYVIHPTVSAVDLANLQKQEFQVCLDAMETDGCAFHIIVADSNAFDLDPNTHMPITWEWLVSKGFKLANDGLSKTVTGPSSNHGGSIDQIFVSSNINVLNWNVINGYDYAYTENSNAGYVPISDHDFVYADIEFDYSDVVTRLMPMTEIALIQTLDHVSSDTADNYHVPITRNQQGKAILTDAITVTLTADDGYTLSSVTVKVGGTNKTSTYYSNGVVSIPSGTQVSGDIEIIATATEQ